MTWMALIIKGKSNKIIRVIRETPWSISVSGFETPTSVPRRAR
jgi:hypothetical protein